MPHDFDKRKRQFVKDGEAIPHVEVRGLIDKLTSVAARDAAKLAGKFNDGKITASEFNAGMRTLLKSAHIVSASVGRGGVSAMDGKDWQRVSKKLQWQYGYLDKFTNKLERGTALNVVSRAKSYTPSVYISYTDAAFEVFKESEPPDKQILVRLVQNSKEGCDECTADAAEGWVPVDEMGEIGTRECGDWCLCYLEFSDDV